MKEENELTYEEAKKPLHGINEEKSIGNNEFLKLHGITFNDDLSSLDSISIKVTDDDGTVLYEITNRKH